MRNILTIVIFVLGVMLDANAQTQAFFGKKNLISVYATANPRLLPLLSFDLPLFGHPNGYDTYKYDDNNILTERKKIIRYDYHVSYKRIITNRFGIGLDFGYERLNLPRNDWYHYSQDDLLQYNKRSTMVYNVISPMLVIDLYSWEDIAPIGVVTSFGIGPKFFNVDWSQNYRFSAVEPRTFTPNEIVSMDLMAIDIFYDMTLRIPLNRTILFDIGLRIRTGLVLNGSEFSSSGFGPISDSWNDNLRTENLANIFNLKMGLSFAL